MSEEILPPLPPGAGAEPPSAEYLAADNSVRITGVVGFFHILALSCVALRVYVRVFMVRAFGPDDGMIIVVALLALGSWICLLCQVPYGLGRHSVNITIEQQTQIEKINFWKTVISDGFALGLLRISMAISLMRLAKDTKWYKFSLYGVIVFVTLYTIQAVAWLFLYCKPYSGWWEFQWMNPFDPRCADFDIFLNLTYWNVSCNIFTDVLLGTLPIPIIWHLQMKLRVRLYVIGILNLGYFAIIMGVLKAIFMLTTGGDPDRTFDLWVHFWQNLQLNIGIVAACASFLRPLVGRFLKINTTYANQPSNSKYKNSGRTPLGTIGSSNFAGGRSRNKRSANPLDDNGSDEFELHTRGDNGHLDHHVHSTVVAIGGKDGEGKVDEERFHYGVNSSGANSDESILASTSPTPQGGIVCTRDVKVHYSGRK